MAVPAHDQRDFEFAQKYELPINTVIQPADGSFEKDNPEEAFVDPGVLVNSGVYSGMESGEAKKAIIEHATNKGFGKSHITYRLRDWGVSRQRYWGTPIPFIHCDKCGIVPVPENELPGKRIS